MQITLKQANKAAATSIPNQDILYSENVHHMLVEVNGKIVFTNEE